MRCERQGLAAAAGAEIDHLLAGLGAGEKRHELRALVLDLDPALEEFGLRLHGRAAPVLARRDAKAQGRERRLDGIEMRQGIVRLLAGGHLQGVYPQVERRTGGERLHLGHEIVAEKTPERRLDPIREIAGDGGRGGARDRPSRASPLSPGVNGSGAKRSPEQSAATASGVRPRCRRSMPSTMARGVASPMIHAAEAFRRRAS